MAKIVPGNPNAPDQSGFWQHAISWSGSASPRVLPDVAIFMALALIVTLIHTFWPWATLAVGPLEASGAVLGLVLVFRVNAGYDRWWEARKLWGGIVNQSRNIALSALAYGPRDTEWRSQFVRWSASFCHAARTSLRGETEIPEISRLLGEKAASCARSADHLPSFVAFKMAGLLRQARETSPSLDGFAFMQMDRQRELLIDHIGACERILKTPAPRVAAIKVRRFILLFLLLLPFALVSKMGWLTPVVVAFVAYPILSLDLIGGELQAPFSREALSHLPLNEICKTIERNLMSDLEQAEKDNQDE